MKEFLNIKNLKFYKETWRKFGQKFKTQLDFNSNLTQILKIPQGFKYLQIIAFVKIFKVTKRYSMQEQIQFNPNLWQISKMAVLQTVTSQELARKF